MVSGRETVQFVVASTVRSDIVDTLGDSPASTHDLLEALEASTSAVYNSLDALEEKGLIRSADDEEWALTGSGQLVADMVRQRTRCDRLLGNMDEYLQSHDTSVLPRPLRLRIGELAGGDVVCATETEPHRAVDEVAGRIERAERAKVISPIYVESFAAAMPDEADSKLIVDEQVVVLTLEADDVSDEEFQHVGVRVADVDVALAVTDSELLLSLPTLEGGYDAQSEIIVEHDRARRWGTDLFEWYWDDAVAVDRFERTLEA